MAKEIPLTQGKVAIVDDEDYERLSKYRWKYLATSKRYKGYAVTYDFRHGRGDYTLVYMHRFLLNAESGLIVDHINQNKLDNRKVNLRFVTKSQNNSNKGMNRNNTSGYKGVTFYKRTNKWMAQVNIDKKYKCIGYYDTAIEAAQAYNEYVVNNGDGTTPINELEGII